MKPPNKVQHKPCLVSLPSNDSAIFSSIFHLVLKAIPAKEKKSFLKMKKSVFKRRRQLTMSNAIDRIKTANLETSFIYYQTHIYILSKSVGNF